ncbi:MFS transporter [Deinococcus knuensis]|uniref:MFS transporter n=1 Tax=Deinococcus knuensis TaxID=1837380 RepID=A0ABQ2SSD1_9DEIO|nr:MFS transporter [Deinococcus knuensis]GGS36459.1 MFS transporter [Deinococcus knuensis]
MWTASFRNYLALITTTGISAVMAGIALSFTILALTESPALLSINLGLYFLPTILSPISGSIVDRYSTRLTLVSSVVIRVFLLVAFALIALADGQNQIPLLLTISLLIGIVKLPHSPGLRKVLTASVNKTKMLESNGVVTSFTQTGTAMSLLASGFLIEAIGPAQTVLLAAGLFMLTNVFIWLAPNVRPDPSSAPIRRFDLSGYSLILRSRTLLVMTVTVILVSLFSTPLESQLPKLMIDWGFNARGFSQFLVAMSVGVIASGLVINKFGNQLNQRLTITAAVALIALVFVGIAYGHGTLLAMLGYGLTFGFAQSIIESFVYAHLHATVEESVQGRLFAAVTGLDSLSTSIGYLILGGVSSVVSGSIIFVACAVIMLVVLLYWAVGRPIDHDKERLGLHAEGEKRSRGPELQ